jgi:cation transport ATPase
VVLKQLANRLMNRLTNNRRFIVGFNTAIIFGGVFGIFMPGLAAILHNSSTVGICLYNMTNVLKDNAA